MNLKKVSVAAVFFYLAAFLAFSLAPKNGLSIKFFDVGQGDSIFIRVPNGKTILIDGGGNNEASSALNREMFFPFCRIDYLILTHVHADHLVGLNRIMTNCQIGEVRINDIVYRSAALDDFREIIKKNNVKTIFSGDIIRFDEVYIKILWPTQESLQNPDKNLNNTSVVLFLDYKDFEGLFLGDAELKVQEKLDLKGILPYIDNGLDVLKVAHHGSKNGLDMDLITSLKPKECVISVGAGNTYGLPDPAVTASLKDSGCKVKRTDLMGDIVIQRK